jgi:hypothetical protein
MVTMARQAQLHGGNRVRVGEGRWGFMVLRRRQEDSSFSEEKEAS